MAITVDCTTRIVSVPQADLTPISGSLYELDVDWLRLQLKSWEYSTEGMAMPVTHRHNTAVTLSGVTYARTVEIVNGYTVAFQNVGSPYTVRCAGANHNLADVTNFDGTVSLIIGNAAGLIAVDTGGGGGGYTPAQIWQHTVEGSLTAEQIVRVLLSVLAGKVSGAGTGVESFRNLADTKTRVASTVDEDGNRTAVVLDGT